MTRSERIAKYVEACPPAESGKGGHNQTFKLACRLYNGWGLSVEETLAWLKVYNRKCVPPWTERELIHKAQSAARAVHSSPHGHLIGADWEGKPEFRLAKRVNSDWATYATELSGIASHAYLCARICGSQKDPGHP